MQEPVDRFYGAAEAPDVEIEELVFIPALDDPMHISEREIREIGCLAGGLRFAAPEEPGVGIAGAVGIEIDLAVFERDVTQMDAACQQTFPEVTGDVDLAGVEEIVMMLVPGAVAQGYSGEMDADRGEVAEKGDVEAADAGVALEPGVKSFPGPLQDGLFMELDIGGKAQPGKK